MNFQLQSNLVTLIMFTLCLLVYPSLEVSAKGSLSIKADKVMALNPSKQSPHNKGLIAWTYGGSIYHLDSNLNVKNLNVKKIVENDGLSISNIIQVSNSLFISGNAYTKGGEKESYIETEDFVIEYDISKGLEKSRWSNPNYLIRSIASDDKAVFLMLYAGELIKLTSNGFQKIAQYHDSDHYIPTNKQEPIICTDPNNSKLNWRPSICYRKGEFNWEKIGSWASSTPPFLCNNFLVEKNEATKKHKYIKIRNKDTAANISVIDISIGKQLSKQDVTETSPLSCIGTEIIYASNSSIILRKLPTLEVTHTLKTTSKEISSVTMIDDSVYWVDEKRTIHKMQLQR